MPIDFYRKAVAIQDDVNEDNKVIFNALQTNATRMSADWIRFLKESNFNVSISLDGPREVNDATRVDAHGRGSFRRVADAMNQLAEAEIPFAVLLVISEELLSLGAPAVWDFLQRIRVRNVDFIPVRPPNLINGKRKSSTIHPQFIMHDRWMSFMCEIFDLWWESRGEIRIKMLESILSRIINAEPELCLIGGNCLGNVFAIEPDGELTACDLFLGEKRFAFGDVFETSFEDIRLSPGLANVRAWNRQRQEGYRACPYYKQCNGGCPHDAVIYRGYGLGDRISSCCGWRRVFEHVEERAGEQLSLAQATLQGHPAS